MEKEMREIKFRAWYSGDNPKLLFEMVLKDDDEIYFINKENDIRYDFQVPFVDTEWILEQYTGLKDKNGKEIYEGDIVDIFSEGKLFEKMPIIYSTVNCSFAASNGYWYRSIFDSKDIEIIGNIHEINPPS